MGGGAVFIDGIRLVRLVCNSLMISLIYPVPAVSKSEFVKSNIAVI